MADYSHTIEVREVGRKGAHIVWRLYDDVWAGHIQMPGVNQYADLPDLNTTELLDVFRWMRDILAGTIDKELITPVS